MSRSILNQNKVNAVLLSMKYVSLLFSFMILFNVQSTFGQVKVYDKFDDLDKEILQSKNDTLYVVNFWATWCKPCVTELPYFEQLHHTYKDQKFKVILVSLDLKKSIESKLIPFLKSRDIQSEVVLLADTRANDWIDKVNPEWSGSIPASVFFNKNKYQFLEQEFDSYESLESIVKAFFNP